MIFTQKPCEFPHLRQASRDAGWSRLYRAATPDFGEMPRCTGRAGVRTAAFRWFLALVLPAAVAGCAHLNGNLQTVEPGAYYRSGQMDATTLDITIRRHGIKTVVNLRGESPHESWYRDERALCISRGVAHHDLDWTMSRPPDPESLQAFASLVRDAEKPLLVHCQGGVHRAAVAAACYRLLQGEAVEEVRGELGFFFNDAPIGQLLDLYQSSVDPFDRWLARDYPLQYHTLGLERPEPDAD